MTCDILWQKGKSMIKLRLIFHNHASVVCSIQEVRWACIVLFGFIFTQCGFFWFKSKKNPKNYVSPWNRVIRHAEEFIWLNFSLSPKTLLKPNVESRIFGMVRASCSKYDTHYSITFPYVGIRVTSQLIMVYT